MSKLTPTHTMYGTVRDVDSFLVKIFQTSLIHFYLTLFQIMTVNEKRQKKNKQTNKGCQDKKQIILNHNIYMYTYQI